MPTAAASSRIPCNIAGANGHDASRRGRDSLERTMTREEISRATDLARACMDSDYQDCGR